MRGARIEAAIGALGQPRNLTERLFGDGVVALLEHERRHAQQPELARCLAEVVALLLHGPAYHHRRLPLPPLPSLARGPNHLADLGVPAAAVDARHQAGEPSRLRPPGRRAAFGEPAIIDELDVEPAD